MSKPYQAVCDVFFSGSRTRVFLVDNMCVLTKEQACSSVITRLFFRNGCADADESLP